MWFLTNYIYVILRNISLVAALTEREVKSKYKGSYLGFLWVLLNPILLLAVYTFVFSVVFNARWGGSVGDSKVDFALIMFVGVVAHGMLAEALNKAPSLVVSNPNYVKKILFPLELLPLVSALVAFVHSLVGICALLVVCLVTKGVVHLSVIMVPFILCPLFLYAVGFGLILSSLGVYLRDISQIMGFFTTALLFLSPVFYPVSALPEQYQLWMSFNPLTPIIEQLRWVIIEGQWPSLRVLAISFIGALVSCVLGYAWFQKTRKGFADVL